MSIKYALLGLLSWKPFTGYEMKKIFEESTSMYWSGNNNQIYKALLQLSEEGCVTSETQHQEGAPSKKIYSITEEGLAGLKQWVLSTPEAPDFKKTFLIQLAWTHLLSDSELNELLSTYETEVNLQLLLQEEKARRNQNAPGRTPREELIWNRISENLISSYQTELSWIRGIRRELFGKQLEERMDTMDYIIQESESEKYIEVITAPIKLRSGSDVLEVVALCWNQNMNRMLLHSAALSDDFYDLKTGVAGEILQKLANYNMKAALVLADQAVNKGRFREFITETNKGSQFRIFTSRDAAAEWLIG